MASPSRRDRLRRIIGVLFLVFMVLWLANMTVVRWIRESQQEAIVGPLREHLKEVRFGLNGYVRSVDFAEGNSATDEEIESLKELTHLESLWLEGDGLTDRALAHLTGLKRLEYLYVMSDRSSGRQAAQWTDDGLSYLRGLNSLKRLYYRGSRVTDAGFRELEALHNLKDLVLDDCREATDEGLKSLAGLNRLERLRLSNGSGMTGEGLGAIPNPSGLTSLCLGFVTDGGMRTITRFTNLSELEIRGGPLSADGLRNLVALTSLEKLNLRRVPLDNRTLEESVGEITSLKELRIHDCPITGDALKHLRRLKDLEILDVSATRVDDTSTSYLDGFPRLRHLFLDQTSITPASLPRLLRIRTLEWVGVPFSIPLTPERHRELLKALPNLEWLRTRDDDIDFSGKMPEGPGMKWHRPGSEPRPTPPAKPDPLRPWA
jgi:Leucine-rich repeat (LRR) protein